MKVLGEEKFYESLEPLFRFYEERVSQQDIKHYGMATWTALLADPNEINISLEKVIELALSIAGQNHHFHFIQLPYNIKQNQANTKKNQ
ncbi:hypothetical protein [Tepidibacillus marianensis]|uniref:hypothetical protein n=1 Tax=Tepidibacillus marianensis TaxID=3131995 RepID=UPI0030D2FBD5